MKAYELVSQVKDLALYATTNRDANILQRLNLNLFSLYDMEFHWRALEKYTDITTTAHTGYSAVPTDAGIIYDIRQMTTSPYAKVTYVHPYKLHDYVPQPTIYAENRPRYYTWFGGRIWWYPIPDAAYTMTTWYYAKPTSMQIYSAGTAALSTLALTGTSTYWLSGLSGSATSLYFTFLADARADGTYPWAPMATITANGAATIASAYSGPTTSGAYAITSDNPFTAEFDPYLIYSASILELGRNREMSQLVQQMQEEKKEQLQGLIRNQTSLPDFIEGVADFAREPILLGDDYAKFPFIQGNP